MLSRRSIPTMILLALGALLFIGQCYRTSQLDEVFMSECMQKYDQPSCAETVAQHDRRCHYAATWHDDYFPDEEKYLECMGEAAYENVYRRLTIAEREARGMARPK